MKTNALNELVYDVLGKMNRPKPALAEISTRELKLVHEWLEDTLARVNAIYYVVNDETHQRVVHSLIASIAKIGAELDRRRDETGKQFVEGP